jgi:Predicted membrane protein (DUF2142)
MQRRGPDLTATATTTPGRTRHIDRCSAVFVLLSLLFGIAFALLTPPMWGQDEPAHFGRAYAVAHGQLLPEQVPSTGGVDYGGQVPATVQALAEYAGANFAPPPPPPPQVADPGEYRRLASRPLDAPLVDRGFPNTSAYSPLPYVPSVIGLRLAEAAGGSVGSAILLMRLCDLVAYTAIVWAALWFLRRHAVRWVVFVVALLPMTVYEASTVTADTLTNALAILLGALFVKAVFLRRDLTRTETGLLLASAVLLPLAKPLYVLLTLLLLVVPAERLALRRWRRPATVGGTVVGVLAFGAWFAASSGVQQAMHHMRPDVATIAPGEQLRYVLTHLPQFVRTVLRTLARQGDVFVSQLFGHLGSTYVPVPLSAVLCCLVAALLAAGLAERLSATRRQVAAAAALVVLTAAAVFVVEYLDWSPVGAPVIEGVQGRYFLPLVVVAEAVVLQVVPLRLHVPTERIRLGVTASIVALMALGLARSVLAFVVVLGR